MNTLTSYRSSLSARLLRAALAATLVVPAVAACNGEVKNELGSGGGRPGGSTAFTTTTTYAGYDTTVGGGTAVSCLAWPQAGFTCQGSTGVGVSVGSGTGGAGTGSSGFGGAGGDGSNPCPPGECGYGSLVGNGCGVNLVLSEGVYANGSCCYEVATTSCMSGRPFLQGARALTAVLVTRDGLASGLEAPRVQGLSLAARRALADAWCSDALLEHASIASFGRFAMDLMALGAPDDLVEAAHLAALDEMKHQRLCFGLASAYAGRPLAAGRFPFGPSVNVAGDLVELAVSAVREGCVGETLAAIQAAEQLDRASDPAVRHALAIIAEDEARHAELAWRAVAWAVATGGERVRVAVADAFEASLRALPTPAEIAPELEEELATHGRLGPSTLRATFARAAADVLRPAAAAMTRGTESELGRGERATSISA